MDAVDRLSQPVRRRRVGCRGDTQSTRNGAHTGRLTTRPVCQLMAQNSGQRPAAANGAGNHLGRAPPSEQPAELRRCVSPRHVSPHPAPHRRARAIRSPLIRSPPDQPLPGRKAVAPIHENALAIRHVAGTSALRARRHAPHRPKEFARRRGRRCSALLLASQQR